MTEDILEGLPAAPGLAVGRARLAHARVESRERIAEPRRPLELERARAALTAAGDELEALALRLDDDGRADEAEMVRTGVLMAEDDAHHRATLKYRSRFDNAESN